jgi:rhodanese-related sulfurtransferase
MSSQIKEINQQEFDEIKARESTLIIDVREKEEFLTYNIGGLNMPAHLLKEHLNELQKYQNLVIVCSNGLRSHIMARVIQKKIPSATVFHLTEGIL